MDIYFRRILKVRAGHQAAPRSRPISRESTNDLSISNPI